MNQGAEGHKEEKGEEVSVLCEIPPDHEAIMPYGELVSGKTLEIRDDNGFPLGEVRPVFTVTRTVGEKDKKESLKMSRLLAFELAFMNGEKVLLNYPADFNAYDFVSARESEGGIVNMEFLQRRLAGIAPEFALQINHTGVKVRNLEKARNEFCAYRGRKLPGPHDFERGRSGFYWKSPTGSDAVFDGTVNDGRRVYAITTGKVGKCEKYDWNEDSVGVGIENGRFVLGDGIGGGNFGECASSYMVDAVLSSGQKKFADALLEAHYRFYIYNRLLLLTGVQGCDTVLAGVQVKGNAFEAFNIGDTKWRLIRDGKVVAKSRTQSFVGRLLEEGRITEVEALTHDARNFIDNTAGSVPFAPDISSGELKEGDTLWVFDDGLALSEEEICRITLSKDFTPAKAARRAMLKTRARNERDEYELPDGKGGKAKIPAPRDNVGLIIYRH